jgi:hypothetical protein
MQHTGIEPRMTKKNVIEISYGAPIRQGVYGKEFSIKVKQPGVGVPSGTGYPNPQV